MFHLCSMKFCDKAAYEIMVDIQFHLTFLLVGLLTLHTDCEISGSLIRSLSDDSTVGGDPAPGRSPGPPTLQGTSEEYPSIFLDVAENFRDCSFNTNAVSATNNILDVDVTHRLFKTDLLVPDIVYQVTLSRTIEGNDIIEFSVTSSVLGKPAGVFAKTDGAYNCNEYEVAGDFTSELHLDWSFTQHIDRTTTEANVTFEVTYRIKGTHNTYRIEVSRKIRPECQLWLKHDKATLTHRDFPLPADCQTWFPNQNIEHGLVIEITRLNVPCTGGYLHISGLNITQHTRSHKQTHICGKLEQLAESEKRIYLPSLHIHPFLQIHGSPVFTLSYRLVDHCYNITFLARNGSFELKPTSELDCTFHIYLPYGYRVQLLLEVGDSTSTGVPETGDTAGDANKKGLDCKGLFTQLLDGENTWSHCTRTGDAEKRIEMVSRENKVVLKVSVRSVSTSALGLQMNYRADAVEEITGLCGFGWVAVKQFCISAVEGAKLPWAQAEMECRRREGHLASVRNEHTQRVINSMLMNSPVYSDHNAYWIGATDKSHDGDFRWSDGLPFSYTNWFPGWQQYGFYNRQPNDDGLSNQDCVEMRRMFSLPSSAADLAPSFMWNDRDCATPNYFICERLQTNEQLEEGWPLDCNRSIVLTRQQPRTAIASPGFPKQYPDNVDCDIFITAPPGYRLILDFEELVLENEPSCSYDYLEIIEDVSNSSNANSSNVGHRRLCGDWSSKLKLLRHISGGARLRLKFSSDYSHHFGGFKARVSIENTLQCEDDRLHLFNSACYLFVNYPEVTWTTALKICEGLGASLASVLSPEEEKFITTNIRSAPEYRTSAIYWLGAIKRDGGNMQWINGSELKYVGWLPGQKLEKFNSDMCLGTQWMVSPTPMLPSGLYWKFHKCTEVGGYVCKRPSLTHTVDLNLNQTINGTTGNITTPNHPSKYYNNLDFYVKLIGPENTRITVVFRKIDIEDQSECLYDYVQINDGLKVCGNHEYDLDRFNFVSNNNEAVVKFHSDFSLTGSGFFLEWRAVEVIGCPKQTLTAKEGVLLSPNYPDFLLPHLDCSITILAPPGKRIWLQFEDYNFKNFSESNQAKLLMSLSEDAAVFQPFQLGDLLTDGAYISYGEYLNVHLKTEAKPKGRGYRALYRIINLPKEERVVLLSNVSTGNLLHLNFPDKPASNIDFKQHLSAPLGYTISLQLYNVKLNNSTCSNNQSVLEIFDTYSNINGTKWRLCYLADEQNSVLSPVPTVIKSFLNSILLRQINLNDGFLLNASLQIHEDPNYRNKLLRRKKDFLEHCHLYPCLNDGKCITNGTEKFCKCSGHFSGPFCAFTLCEMEPCVFGKCELTPTSFLCHCKSGYTGSTCSKKKRPCVPNPCENKGTCTEKGNNFKCSCRAWWEGPRCERKMQKIPYTPLSERMFHEPFWLGLMTVTVVMAVIGLVWCAKRHFPEKIEKLLAEDDRNQSTMSSLRSASVREQLAASGTAAITVTPNPGPGAPKSLFGRLGIRKPSILSLTSPHASGYVPATARTFSLDDLLKPPLRRTPSPKKKRNNSTPTKKNVTEKKQILQQLVSPAGSRQNSKKVNLGELMQLDERKAVNDEVKQDNDSFIKETKFPDKNSSTQAILSDPKLEKKVTFARLLNKVSAEMSSGSEMEMGIMQTNRLGYAFARPSSTPPSPIVDSRSPNSTCSNHGSGSLTSSDLAIPSALSNSISDFLSSRRQIKSPGKQKPASADSILAMFRNFSTTSVGTNVPSSLRITPSTTPTASSPQDDAIADDDDSSTSSIHTPISFSSGPPESPVLQHRQSQSTIEVPVLDPFSAHKSPSGGGNFLHPPTILLEIPSTINKCLSPIREMPTPLPSPMPSPALTPVMKRNPVTSAARKTDFTDDSISVELPQMPIICSNPEDESKPTAIALDPQGEDGLILEEAAVMHKSSSTAKVKTKKRPPPLGHCESPTETHCDSIVPLPLVIPTLTIQTPSPTHAPYILIPGSPPPQRKFSQPDCSFDLKQPRKMLKEFDKPTSLDLPGIPPLITITCNMSETESDAESTSPATKSSSHLSASSTGMTYLSPFSIARTDHNASESNLSSSGYSSMASPGPSRCGSNNPLCPSEMEDPGAGSHYSHLARRSSPQLKTNFHASSETTNDKANNEKRGRSDSETLSDDPLLESNDEGIGTDHLDEKAEEGELKGPDDIEVFVINDTDCAKGFKDFHGSKPCVLTSCEKSLDENMDHLLPPSSNCKNSLQLPSIVVQCDSGTEKPKSPMSSRSESPLSDRTSGMDRFSSKFYGQHKDLLPFTDSDGLYDFPSSDKVNVTSLAHQHKRSSSKKREKKLLRNCKTPSPTKSVTMNSLCYNLDVPIKEHFYKIASPRKPSPKRRIRPQVVSSSSSSEGIISAREGKQEPTKWPTEPERKSNHKCRKSSETSEEESADDASSVMLPKSEELFKHTKINRLRAISHQIRFLRRLERSLKRRERTKSPSDSLDSECDDDPSKVTSPLLQQDSRKSQNSAKTKRGKLRRSEPLSANEEYDFKQSVMAGNGYSN